MGMSELVVAAVLVEGRSKSEVAREYGVSRRWVITCCQRFLVDGEKGLVPRSRRPHSSPHQTPTGVEEEILRIRKELDRDGHDAGAATIAFHLEQRTGSTPAVSTIWRILTQRGFVTPQPHKRPKSSWQRFQAEQPNERWQLDITHWHLCDGTSVEVLDVIDDHSRLAISVTAMKVFKAPDVDAAYRKAAALHGDPASMLSDNGAVFTGRPRGDGRVALEKTLHQRGVVFRHSRPYHPQTCGKVERFHQTLKKWLATQPPMKTLRGLQNQLNRFTTYYNQTRPHRALRRRTPATAYQARPKAIATGTPIDAKHFRVRHDRVDNGGVFTLRHHSRLHHIGVGRSWAGTDILVLAHELHIRVLTDTGELIRDLTLDPTKDYQPQ